MIQVWRTLLFNLKPTVYTGITWLTSLSSSKAQESSNCTNTFTLLWSFPELNCDRKIMESENSQISHAGSYLVCLNMNQLYPPPKSHPRRWYFIEEDIRKVNLINSLSHTFSPTSFTCTHTHTHTHTLKLFIPQSSGKYHSTGQTPSFYGKQCGSSLKN